MRHLIAAICIFCISISAIAQTPLTWQSPMTVNTSIGSDWARVATTKSGAVVVWGDFTTGTILMRKFSSGSFGTETHLTPDGFAAYASGITGPDMKSSGDTVFVTYMGSNIFHAYLLHSYDGGNTFSDTIRIDHIGDNFAQYPALDIMPGGNPIISFAELNSGFSDPQYVVTKSFDGGNTFTPDVNATETLGADPCDCCPGTIAYHDSTVCVIYRNAINNDRDMRAAISLDDGNTFTNVGNIDNSGWTFASCPSIGGEGVIEGDTLTSVFMNGLGGNTCYVSTLNIKTLGLGFKKHLFNLQSSGSQTHPRMVAKGDTMAAVWQQSINGHSNIMFSYSLTGASGLGESVDTISNIIPNGFHANPDVAYSHGIFYVAFSDAVANKIYLMEGILFGTTGMGNTPSDVPSIQFVNNLSGEEINILSNKTIHESCFVSIYNASGLLCESHELHSLQHAQTLKLDRKLSSGLYLIRISSNEMLTTGKLMIAH